ncbi:hypothetical protein MKY91_20595 [Alkalicoccobacillus gibsonii]|uniref:Uncharacterized protein n=1 Tax=Alkalicoccobacillus gibsonii TaxID=79881 RepID=A0ABU9VNY2_9BACI
MSTEFILIVTTVIIFLIVLLYAFAKHLQNNHKKYLNAFNEAQAKRQRQIEILEEISLKQDKLLEEYQKKENKEG